MAGPRPVIPFSQIVGQERAVRLLKQAISQAKMPHAYLFVGAPGVGRTTTALALAQALNCEAPEAGQGCGRCRSCRRLRGGNHPDVALLEPDGQSLKIEQVRDLEHRFAYKPIAGTYRVTVVRPAEAMTEEASHAFLTTLEEPPGGNVLILINAAPSDLLTTIVSRCVKVVFRRIPTSAIEQWLVDQKGVHPEKASILARMSEGSLGRALEMEESGFLEKRREHLLALGTLQRIPQEEVLDWASRFVKKHGKEERQEEIGTLLSLWKTWYRDLLLLKVKGPEELLINEDLSHQLKIAAEAFMIESLSSSLLALDQAEKDLVRFRNQELILENTVLRLKQNASAGGG